MTSLEFNKGSLANLPQRAAWKSLSVSTDFFKGCKKHAIIYIPAEHYTRKYYFLDCENIIFRTEEGETLWSTMGNGEIELPAAVGVYIKRGKMKGG